MQVFFLETISEGKIAESGIPTFIHRTGIPTWIRILQCRWVP